MALTEVAHEMYNGDDAWNTSSLFVIVVPFPRSGLLH